RRRGDALSRRWKVTLFDVRGADLCRPVADLEEPARLEGAVTCARGKPAGLQDGCGFTVDRADGSRGLEAFRIRWEDAARDGFCVLPVDRFVAEAARGGRAAAQSTTTTTAVMLSVLPASSAAASRASAAACG